MARLIEARIRDVERQATRLQGLRRMIEAARRDPVIRDLLLGEVERQPMREMDRRRIAPLIEEWRGSSGSQS
jgi:hypothetical protein